jgi:GNAT superfamily N-acetyltransferase
MAISVRPANANDAQAIASVIQLSLGDEVQANHIQRVMSETDHASFVAVADEQVIGFVDGFLTNAQDGTLRWELDLLGVHPDFRGLGAGQKLIEVFTTAGKSYGATLSRALVAISNKPMHAAMTRTGYQLQPLEYQLMVSSGSGNETKLPENAYLIPVNTFTYRGIWLEGEITLQTISAANAIREKNKLDVIGAVVLTTDQTTLNTVNAAAFHLIGKFNWWTQAIE